MHDFIHDTERKSRGLFSALNNYERTILESRACWESGKNRTWARIQQKRLITYRTLINLGPRFIAERDDMRQVLTYIAYFHTHTLDVNHTNETITVAKDVDSLFP